MAGCNGGARRVAAGVAAAPTYHDLAIMSMDRGEVLRYMGYHGQGLGPDLGSRIDEAMARCLEVSRPRAAVAVFEVAGRTDDGVPEVSLAGTPLVLRGSSIARHLDGAVAAGVMAVTLGMGDECELHRLSLVDPVGQVLFDAASTTLVERAADAAEALLVGAAAAGGLHCNVRFSPGYGDLPMDTQPPLLAALGASRLGITLSPTYLMTPTKSVTAVVGLFDTPQAGAHASCADCLCSDFCIIRRTGTTCHG